MKDMVGVALIFHFDTMTDARRARERLLAIGLGGVCDGHLWDEEENTGFVVVDAGNGRVHSHGAHILPEPALIEMMGVIETLGGDPETYALLPVELMSSEMCLEEEESNEAPAEA